MPDARLKYLALLSVAAAILTMGLKFAAYLVTDSVGLLSDAAESLVNLFAAATAFLSLWYASRPVDPSHTYGHEKIEFFSSGIEGILILVAAGGIAYYAILRLISGQTPQALDLGMGLALGASAINLSVALVLLRVGRATGSIVLEADGRHLMTDVWTSAAVIAGLAMVGLTGWQWLDPAVALVVAGNICWTGFDLVWRSFNGLMDHALPEEEQTILRAAIESCLQPGMDYHAVRTRQAGSQRFVDFHLLVPGSLTVQHAHQLTERIEDALRTAFPRLEITVHIEPIEETRSWEDSALVPLEQAARRRDAQRSDGG